MEVSYVQSLFYHTVQMGTYIEYKRIALLHLSAIFAIIVFIFLLLLSVSLIYASLMANTHDADDDVDVLIGQ